MKDFGIKMEWLTRYPSELSGGELQRFNLARALSGNVSFLVADEITTMLDAVTQAQIWKVLLDISEKKGIGILVISHDLALLEKVTQGIIHMDG